MQELSLDPQAQSIHTKSRPNPEIIRSFVPVYEQRVSRFGNNTVEPFGIPNPVNGSRFFPELPDNTPDKAVMAVSYIDKITGKTTVDTYQVDVSPDGKLLATKIPESGVVSDTIAAEITGKGKGDYYIPPKLTGISVGHDIEARGEGLTTFRAVNTAKPVVNAGDNYFSVAIATPKLLERA